MLLVGSGWLISRNWFNLHPARSGQDKFLTILMSIFLIHFSLRFVLPVVTTPKNLIQTPWPWMAFLHSMVALAWMTDVRRYIRKEDLKFLIQLMAGLGVFLSTYMVFQFFSIDPLIYIASHTYPGFKWLHGNHVIGLMGGPFQAGAALAVLVPCISYQAFIPSQVKMKTILWSIGLAISLIACWMTQSSSALMAAGVGSVIASGKIKTVRHWILAILLALSILLFLSINHSQLLLDNGRIYIWKQALPILSHHPFLGIGLNQFKLLGISSIQDNPASYVWWAHNEWVHFATEIGIPFALLLAAYLAVQARKLSNVHPAMFASFLSVIILSFLNVPWHLAPTLVVTGICLASSHLEPNRS